MIFFYLLSSFSYSLSFSLFVTQNKWCGGVSRAARTPGRPPTTTHPPTAWFARQRTAGPTKEWGSGGRQHPEELVFGVFVLVFFAWQPHGTAPQGTSRRNRRRVLRILGFWLLAFGVWCSLPGSRMAQRRKERRGATDYAVSAVAGCGCLVAAFGVLCLAAAWHSAARNVAAHKCSVYNS